MEIKNVFFFLEKMITRRGRGRGWTD